MPAIFLLKLFSAQVFFLELKKEKIIISNINQSHFIIMITQTFRD